MSPNSTIFCLLAVLFFSCPVLTEVAPFTDCPQLEDGASRNCTVHEVRVNPCAEASENKPCKIKRGKSASIQFDFTSGSSSSEAFSRAYWANEVTDLPFLGMNTDACQNTACPITADQRQTYVYDLPISKKYPARTYDVKWKLNGTDVECCFIFQIKLVK
ncbi:MD-2-related lipid-recognition protein [Anabrus simplex]|uniref:MD-2-related lipid-recognition protein n=1 Tax=Anabrus simplex TaxID=316456 RepID=UPI0034DCC75E